MCDYENEDEQNEAEGWTLVREERALLTDLGWEKGTYQDKYLYEENGGYPTNMIAEYHVTLLERDGNFKVLARRGVTPGSDAKVQKALTQFGSPLWVAKDW